MRQSYIIMAAQLGSPHMRSCVHTHCRLKTIHPPVQGEGGPECSGFGPAAVAAMAPAALRGKLLSWAASDEAGLQRWWDRSVCDAAGPEKMQLKTGVIGQVRTRHLGPAGDAVRAAAALLASRPRSITVYSWPALNPHMHAGNCALHPESTGASDPSRGDRRRAGRPPLLTAASWTVMWKSSRVGHGLFASALTNCGAQALRREATELAALDAALHEGWGEYPLCTLALGLRAAASCVDPWRSGVRHGLHATICRGESAGHVRAVRPVVRQASCKSFHAALLPSSMLYM